MSADRTDQRQRLIRVMGGADAAPPRLARIKEMVANYDDLLAHDLAEYLRTTMRAPGRSYDASRWNRVVDTLADELDPYVTG